MAAHSPLREAATHVVLRLRSEVALLVAQLRVILAAVLYLVYFGYMLFRNLAFYNFTPGPVLHDLGHAAIPALGPTLHAVAEVPMAVLYVLITAMSLATFVPAPPTAPSKPYFVNMFRRFVVVLCLGHTLRFLSYALTSLPGAAAHCLPENIASITPPQPTTVAEVLTRYAARPGSNCGDLVFSGHMLQAILFALIVARYAQRCFAIADSTHLLLCAAVSALVAVQAVFVVAARNHYTVDIVVASYTTPLLWYFYCRELQPTDLDLSAAPAVLPTTAPPKRRRRPSSADSAFSDVAADEAEDTCLL